MATRCLPLTAEGGQAMASAPRQTHRLLSHRALRPCWALSA
jgi:hypothetical protein